MSQSESLRKNNFDIVRLTLAGIVVLKHCSDLSGSQALWPLHKTMSGPLAIEGFFAISGFLIFASYERSKSLWDYSLNRALRIFPGYWLSTILCLLIAFSTGHFHVGRFLLGNLTFSNFLSPGIPGVFANNPSNPMNGALWTIKIELMFYVSVPIIVWLCRKLNRDAVLVAIFVLSVIFRLATASHEKVAIQYPGQASFFMVGALVYYHLASFKANGKWLVALGAIAYAANVFTGWFIFRPIAIPLLVLGAAFLLPQFKGPAKYGDFSYGTYILHWPLVQLMVASGLFFVHPWLGVAASLALVCMAAVLSWFFVEKPALAHSPSKRMRREALQDSPQYPVAVP